MPPDIPEEIRARIEEVRTDNTSGAVALSRRAAGTFAILAGTASISPASRLLECLGETARALARAQPAMAPILNLANSVLWRAGEAAELRQIQAEVEAACREFVDGLDAAGEQVSRQASGLIRDGIAVITHSYSQTVLNALVAARKTGKQFEVICPEARPICEGVALARDLGNAGIPVTLIVDAAMLSVLPRVRMVMVGADSISSRGLVNKTGTSLLALAVQRQGADFYALCGSEKFLPEDYVLPEEPRKPPSEVTEERSPNVTVANFYFDLTPLDLITGVVVEDGILTPERVKQRLRRTKTHPALLGRTDT